MFGASGFVGVQRVRLATFTSQRSEGLSPTVAMEKKVCMGTWTIQPLEAVKGSWSFDLEADLAIKTIQNSRVSGCRLAGIASRARRRCSRLEQIVFDH